MILDKLLKSRHMVKTINATRRLLSERGESNAASMANELVELYNELDDEQRDQYFQYLAEKMNPSPADVLSAAQSYANEASADNLIWLMKVTEAPRQELFRRLNRASGGTKMIIDMRKQLIKSLDKKANCVLWMQICSIS